MDFARYATWEINLERLRQKRCKKLKIKGSSSHAGQAQIFRIFDRGTKKHPGDLGLWFSYLQYTREAKASKKFETVLTSAIRLHCTKPELWLYAAKWALEEQADMRSARSYMQKGTRFCTMSKELWIEYAKLEMIYLKKIALRRRILGLDGSAVEQVDAEEVLNEEEGFDADADVIAFPDFKAPSLRPSMYKAVQVDDEAKKDPYNTPALQGAIPMAIFDAAQKQPFYTLAVAEAFFDMFTAFTHVPCLPKILQHVIDSMMTSAGSDPASCFCYIRHPVIGIQYNSAEFPAALITALERLWASLETTKDKGKLSQKVMSWFEPILALQELDPGIKKALEQSIRKLTV